MQFDPLGVGLIIGTWNYPLMLTLAYPQGSRHLPGSSAFTRRAPRALATAGDRHAEAAGAAPAGDAAAGRQRLARSGSSRSLSLGHQWPCHPKLLLTKKLLLTSMALVASSGASAASAIASRAAHTMHRHTWCVSARATQPAYARARRCSIAPRRQRRRVGGVPDAAQLKGVRPSTRATATFKSLHLPPARATDGKSVGVRLVVVTGVTIRPGISLLAWCG